MLGDTWTYNVILSILMEGFTIWTCFSFLVLLSLNVSRTYFYLFVIFMYFVCIASGLLMFFAIIHHFYKLIVVLMEN